MFRNPIDGSEEHYIIEFPEYWLAKIFADAVKCAEDVKSVFMLKRVVDDKFDVTEQIK